jgi:hypothetical protein
MLDAGLIVLTAFTSPFRSDRNMVRALFRSGTFLEVFVDAPLAVVEASDSKGLWARVRRGEIPNLTGLDSPYEPPVAPQTGAQHRRAERGRVGGAGVGAPAPRRASGLKGSPQLPLAQRFNCRHERPMGVWLRCRRYAAYMALRSPCATMVARRRQPVTRWFLRRGR